MKHDLGHFKGAGVERIIQDNASTTRYTIGGFTCLLIIMAFIAVNI